MKRICQRDGRVAVCLLRNYRCSFFFVSMVIPLCCMRAAAIGTVMPISPYSATEMTVEEIVVHIVDVYK